MLTLHSTNWLPEVDKESLCRLGAKESDGGTLRPDGGLEHEVEGEGV